MRGWGERILFATVAWTALMTAALYRYLPDVAGQRSRRPVVLWVTDCGAYNEWQSAILTESLQANEMDVFGERPVIVRLVTGCDSAAEARLRAAYAWELASGALELAFYSAKREDPAFPGDDYAPYNRPYAIELRARERLRRGVHGRVVVLLDPDMILVAPLRIPSPRTLAVNGSASWRVGSGHHLAQRYHYILTQWDRHAVNTSAVCGGCDVTAKGLDDVSVGPPWFFSVGDLHRVAERWKEYTPLLRQQHPNFWLAEMYALSLGILVEGLKVEQYRHFAVSYPESVDGEQGWDWVDAGTGDEVAFLHYCELYGSGGLFFDKRRVPPTLLDCDEPLFTEARRSAGGGEKEGRKEWMLRRILEAANRFLRAYKARRCHAFNTSMTLRILPSGMDPELALNLQAFFDADD